VADRLDAATFPACIIRLNALAYKDKDGMDSAQAVEHSHCRSRHGSVDARSRRR